MAVYKMSVLVCAYVCSSRPLLTLTLRHKPLPITGPRKTLAALIDAAGGPKCGNDLTSPARANGTTEDHAFESDEERFLWVCKR